MPAGERVSDIVEQLRDILGAERVLDSAAVAQRATSYWNDAPMQAKALVLPGTTDEVAAVVSACHAAGQAVVTQGGLTNCVTAAEPTTDDIVLTLDRMNRVEDIDAVGGRGRDPAALDDSNDDGCNHTDHAEEDDAEGKYKEER